MKYRDGYVYQLAETVIFRATPIRPPARIETRFIALDWNGDLTIEEGYAWDGPSGPTLDTPGTMTPSLFHDAIYQLLREKRLAQEWRTVADEYMGALMDERGVWAWRRWLWVRELKKFAKSAADPKNAKKVHEVP